MNDAKVPEMVCAICDAYVDASRAKLQSLHDTGWRSKEDSEIVDLAGKEAALEVYIRFARADLKPVDPINAAPSPTSTCGICRGPMILSLDKQIYVHASNGSFRCDPYTAQT